MISNGGDFVEIITFTSGQPPKISKRKHQFWAETVLGAVWGQIFHRAVF